MRYPFDSLRLHPFRGIQELELSGLGRFNFLVGANNSGKTSVLEAFALYCSPLDLATWVGAARRREPPPHSRRHPARQLRWLFPQNGSPAPVSPYRGDIHLSSTGSFGLRELGVHLEEIRAIADKTPIESREFDSAYDMSPGSRLDVQVSVASPSSTALSQRAHSFTILESGATQIPQIEEAPEVKARVITPYAHWVLSLEDLFSQAAREGHRDAAVEMIKALGIRVQHAEIFSDEGVPVLHLRDSVAGFLPVSAFGDGVRRAMLLALAIPLASKGVLLIDELETAIHVSLLGKVFKWVVEACQRYDVQVIATTHSLEAIDAILEADTTPQEDIVAFRLERAQGRLSAKRFSEETLKHLRREMGLDVR